jgi:uncharacterized membrane protein
MKVIDRLTKRGSLRIKQRTRPDHLESSDNILSVDVMDGVWANMLDKQLIVTKVLVGSFGLAGYTSRASAVGTVSSGTM